MINNITFFFFLEMKKYLSIRMHAQVSKAELEFRLSH